MVEQENPWTPFDVTDATIDQEVSKHKIFVIDCWSPTCAPCKTMSKYLDKLSLEYKGEVTFAKLQLEINKATSKKYGIVSVPTLLIFYDGKFKEVIVGAFDPEYIKGVIEDMRKRAREPALV
jgi:thioredoxin 1